MVSSDDDGWGMTIVSQDFDWYLTWLVGWPESQDMIGSISGQKGLVSGGYDSFLSLTCEHASPFLASSFIYLFFLTAYFFST